METEAGTDFLKLHSDVRKLVKDTLNPNFEKIEKESAIPESIVDQFRKMGLFGMSIPKQYGGLGLTTVEEMSLLEEITYTNACFRSRIGTSNSIGSLGILFDGTEEQRKTFLPRIASGKWTAAFAASGVDSALLVSGGGSA